MIKGELTMLVVKKDVDMDMEFSGGRWEKNEIGFFMNDEVFGESVFINRKTREVTHEGFNHMIYEMKKYGVMEEI
jgi:hypothetical protein